MANPNKLQELKASEILCDPENSFIGKGAFGVVISGKHPVYGPVAIKCFSVNGEEAQTIIESFKDESEMLQRANHENVARVHGWAKWHLSLGLVMQYYEGGNLGSLLFNKLCDMGPLLRLRIALEISKSLVFLHNFSPEKSLIHGDLKPDNVLLTSDLHCKLADFGGVRLVNQTGMTSSMGIPQSNAFTPLFAAPEVLDGDHPIKPNKYHDVYSYGMLMYVLLAREYPFSGQGNIFGLLNKIINGVRPACSTIESYKKTLSEPEQAIISCLKSLMLRCWVQSPDKRPTMIQVQEELQKMFDKQSSGLVLEQIMIAVKQLELKPQSSKLKQDAPLDTFISHTAKFDQGFKPPAISETNTGIRPVQENESIGQAEPARPPQKVEMLLEDIFNSKDGDESALDLVQQYLTLVQTKKYEEANRVAVDLQRLIQGQVETTANKFRKLGNKLREKKKYFESVLFLQISSIISANDQNPKKAVEGIMFCAEGLRKTNEQMIESDVTMKVIVRDHVLPVMRDLQLKIEKNKNVDEKLRVFFLVGCLLVIGGSESLIDDRKSQEQSLRKIISTMEKTLGLEASKHRVYGRCLNDLGVLCWETSRITDAVKYYQRALEAKKKAEDYSSEKEKKESIEDTEKYLKVCKEKLGK